EDNSVYSFSHKSGLSSRNMYLKHLGSYGEIGVKYGTGIAYPRNLYVAPGAATICNELWVRNKISRETAVEKLQNMDTDTIIGPFYCDQSHIAWYWNYGTNIYKYEVPGYIVNFTGQHTAECDNITTENVDKYVGLIVVATGEYCDSGVEGVPSITINQALPKVKLSNKRNQKSVFGVITNYSNNERLDNINYNLKLD